MFTADGGKSIKNLLAPTDEPLRPEMEHYGTAEELGVYDMWQIHRKRNEFCKAYLDRWNAAGIDGIICEYAQPLGHDFKLTDLCRSNNTLCFS